MECSVLHWTTLALSSGNLGAQVDHQHFFFHVFVGMSVQTVTRFGLHMMQMKKMTD